MAKHRSPAYPAVDLEEAVSLVEKLYPQATKHPVGVDTVSEIWGYKSLSSASPYIAAAKHFGLLVEKRAGKDRMLQLSETARDIAVDPSGESLERSAALQEAAVAPMTFRQMWEKWGPDLPPDGEIRRYLERERDFNPKYVARVALTYRSSLEFAKLIGADTGSINKDRRLPVADGPSATKTIPDPEASSVNPPVGSFVQPTSNRITRFDDPRQSAGLSGDRNRDSVEGSQAGVAMSELSIIDRPVDPQRSSVGVQDQSISPFSDPMQHSNSSAKGVAQERKTLDEGPIALSMPEDLSPDSVRDLEHWVGGLIERARRRAGGKHLSKPLPNGGTVHLVRHPGNEAWHLKSYDFSWLKGMRLVTATVWAEKNGWSEIEFESPEDAVEFVKQQMMPNE